MRCVTVKSTSQNKWISKAEPEIARAVWTWSDDAYCASWSQIHDRSLLICAQGVVVLKDKPFWNAQFKALAVVGSRNSNAQGVENVHHLSCGLSQLGLCIVSGLALGIDAAAHRVALSKVQNTQASCATIAIVGTVLDRVYPSRHQISQQGLLLIELPIGMGPLGHHFPRRNRLIGRHQ